MFFVGAAAVFNASNSTTLNDNNNNNSFSNSTINNNNNVTSSSNIVFSSILNSTDSSSSSSTIYSSSSPVIAWFKRWPREFFRFLVSSPAISDATMPDSGPWRYDYENSVLHFGEHEYVVLSFWKMGSGLGLAASMLVVALIAVLHEAVLGLRFFLEREQTLLNAAEIQKQVGEEEERREGKRNGLGRREMPGPSYVNQPNNITKEEELAKRERKKWAIRNELRLIFRRTFTKARMLQAALYALQWSLFIFAFVLVPCGTFNVPLIMAALLGKTAGYLLFIGSPAMESVERIPPSPSNDPDGRIQLATTRKSLRSF